MMDPAAPVAPAPPRRLYRASVERVDTVAPETRALFLRLEPHAGFAFVPGQFVSLALTLAGRPAVRPYSIASDPEQPDVLEICLNRVPGGEASAYLCGLAPGAVLEFTGPFGAFVLDRAPDTECVFVGEGTGVAPLRPMLRRAVSVPTHGIMHLLHAVPTPDYLLYRADFEAAARTSGVVYEPVVEGPSDAAHQTLAALVRQRYAGPDTDRRRQFFICGVGDIVTRLRDLLRGAGYERRAVHYEKW